MITYLVSIATIGVIAAILAAGLNVRWGWAGEFDLAYYTFVSIGAYIAAVLVAGPSAGIVATGDAWILGYHWPFIAAVLAAMLTSSVISLGFGAIALRKLKGDYFAITAIAFTLIVTAIFSQEYKLFDGFEGVFGVPQPFNSALNLGPDTYGYFYLGLCAVAFVMVYGVLELLYRSPFGRSLRSIRENELAAAAFGTNVYRGQLKAYFIGGLVAGLGGALYVGFLGAWDPSDWSPFETFLLFAAVFVGGQANLRGTTLGAFIVIVGIPEITRYIPPVPGAPDLLPAVRDIAIGVTLIAVLRWHPQGLIPEPRHRDTEAARQQRVEADPVGTIADG